MRCWHHADGATLGLHGDVPTAGLLTAELEVLQDFALRHCDKRLRPPRICREAADRSAAIAVQLEALSSTSDLPVTFDTPDWNIFGSGHEVDGMFAGACVHQWCLPPSSMM
jgi:hypothetical protein